MLLLPLTTMPICNGSIAAVDLSSMARILRAGAVHVYAFMFRVCVFSVLFFFLLSFLQE